MQHVIIVLYLSIEWHIQQIAHALCMHDTYVHLHMVNNVGYPTGLR